MQAVYGDQFVYVSIARRWVRRFKNKTPFFKDGFQKLVQRWRKCVVVSGDFVEK
jgi:hypothetical protein